MKAIFSIIISGFLAVSGYAQTRNVLVGTNNTVVQPTNFWSVDASNARTGLGLGTAATNPASAFQPSSSVLSNLASSNAVNLTNIRATNIVGIIPTSNIAQISLTDVSGVLAVSNGGTGATNSATARTNLGLGASNDVPLRTLVLPQADGLGSATAYGIQWRSIYPASNGIIALSATDDQGQTTLRISTGTMSGTTAEVALFNTAQVTFYEPLLFNNTTNAAITRTNLGLGWSALTNTSVSGFSAALYGANTNPVLVNSNSEVVSPTNFWQVAPIQTLVQNTAPNTNSTNAATNARNLYIYSLATNIINVTNTITLPTNTSSFDGDEVTVIHRGGSNSVTAVRQLGSTNNLISLNFYDESVKFIKDGNWDFYHNISFTEAIRFSGTNAAANAAASRTNLGLGATWLTNTDVTNFRAAIGLGTTNVVSFSMVQATDVESINVLVGLGGISFEDDGQSVTRTNLGIPLAALTNTSVTNFQKAIFYTNTAPSNIGGNLGTIAAWIEVVASNGVTYKIPAYTNVP